MTNPASLEGYIRLRKRVTASNIDNDDALASMLESMRDAYAPPMVDPTFALVLSSTSVDGNFSNWRLGDYVDYAINDPYRFPTVRKGNTRVTGWALRPGASDGPEEVSINTRSFDARLIQEGI